jgi:hypothetical protein
LQDWSAAQEAYELAEAAWRRLGDTPRCIEAQTGLARTLLAMGKEDELATAVAPILSFLETNTPEGANDPGQIYLTCAEILAAASDPRAADYRQAGRRFAQAQADRLTHPDLRQTFLARIPAHRALFSE